MNYSHHAQPADNTADEDLTSPALAPGDKVTLDPEFEAWANLVAGVLFTVDDLKSADDRAAVDFVDHVLEDNGTRLGVFSPAAWRAAFRRHVSNAGGRSVRHAGHARARRVANIRRPAASASDDGGDGSGDPDPAATWDTLIDDFCTAKTTYVAFGPAEEFVEALEDAVSALAGYSGWDRSLNVLVAAADGLREDAAEFNDDLLRELADALAPAADFPATMETLTAAWRAYRPHAALTGAPPTAEARAALRRATAEARAATPRCPSEFGRKAKVAAIVGINALVRRSCPRPDPYAVGLYEHFLREVKSIPPWFFAEALGCRDAELGPSRETFVAEPGLIDELLEAAVIHRIPRYIRDDAGCVGNSREFLDRCGKYPEFRTAHSRGVCLKS